MSWADDARFMRAALGIGARELGRTWPNPAVGAIIVREGRVVGRVWTGAGGRPHAEVAALTDAGEGARGATLYVTLEPCSHHGRTPPCADAIIRAGVARVVAAMEDPNPLIQGAGLQRLRDAGIAVTTGVCAAEAAAAHAGHVARVTAGRPHVMLKFAVSADGKAAFAGGRQAQITEDVSRAQVHMMRAHADAIMVGIGTAIADDPALTCRLPGMADRSPVRIVVDTGLRLPLNGMLVRSAAEVPVWVVAGPDAPREAERALQDAGCNVLRVSLGPAGGVDLEEMVRLLASLGITRLMVEGGPMLAEAFLNARLVDAAAIFEGTVRLGPHAPDAFSTGPRARLEAAGLHAISDAAIGADRLTLFARGS